MEKMDNIHEQTEISAKIESTKVSNANVVYIKTSIRDEFL